MLTIVDVEVDFNRRRPWHEDVLAKLFVQAPEGPVRVVHQWSGVLQSRDVLRWAGTEGPEVFVLPNMSRARFEHLRDVAAAQHGRDLVDVYDELTQKVDAAEAKYQAARRRRVAELAVEAGDLAVTLGGQMPLHVAPVDVGALPQVSPFHTMMVEHVAVTSTSVVRVAVYVRGLGEPMADGSYMSRAVPAGELGTVEVVPGAWSLVGRALSWEDGWLSGDRFSVRLPARKVAAVMAAAAGDDPRVGVARA